ncbi:MAG: transposase [Planctomycetaceae bacterium]
MSYFITFSTYGTWLPGSAKGSVDSEHNQYGTQWLPAAAEQEQQAREAMTQSAYTMNPDEREIVCRALVNLAEERGWLLLAAHVRSNHVHLVVQADREPGRVMSDFKARYSRELTRAGYDDAQRRRWTRHGSTRHLFREGEVEAAIRYTLDEQGSHMAWYAHEPRTK